MAVADHKDIRSASIPFKRDKEHNHKWSKGACPLPGVRSELPGLGKPTFDNEVHQPKMRPVGPWKSEPNHHGNRAPKLYNTYQTGSIVNKVNSIREVNDHTSSPLSQSLLDLLPTHANNKNLLIRTTAEPSWTSPDEILYSYDNKGPSPGPRGREIDLGGLIEKAEKKWEEGQVERIVKGEYEVLDADGETTQLTSGKKGKRSPKQKATKPEAKKGKTFEVEEDDGFELI
jgi:hypothetical protein